MFRFLRAKRSGRVYDACKVESHATSKSGPLDLEKRQFHHGQIQRLQTSQPSPRSQVPSELFCRWICVQNNLLSGTFFHNRMQLCTRSTSVVDLPSHTVNNTNSSRCRICRDLETGKNSQRISVRHSENRTSKFGYTQNISNIPWIPPAAM